MTKKNLPRISIVTPSYNQGEYIEDTILSVLEQGYPNLEYIIIDGGSRDQSVEIIKKYAKHLAYWVSEQDRGQTDAINRGLRIATGDILAYLNSDDFYLPNALNYIAQSYQVYPNAGLYMGTGISVDRNKNNPKRYSRTVGFDYEALLKGSCYVLQPATFINRMAYEKVGELDDTLKYGMDLEYWLRIGKEFPVVVIDEPLAAYRIYENIKTIQGGFERWVELWRIYRKYTDLQITPGLLVEFFSILKNPTILNQLGMDVKDLAESGFQKTYSLMQTILGLEDCIPTGKGILFTPKKNGKKVERKSLHEVKGEGHAIGVKENRFPVIQTSRYGSKPRVDFVLQATGVHAWGVGGGWVNAARELGVFHRVFAPKANWGDQEPYFDDGLFGYLANPQSDIILLLGFDWHSQMLHLSPRWKDRWKDSKALKVLYVQESIENASRLSGHEEMKRAFSSALECVDAIVYTDITDRPLMDSVQKPAIWQPFGVDATVFNRQIPFKDRIRRAFFRGKSAAFSGQPLTYQQRRDMIQYLLENNLLDWIEYSDRPVSPQEIAGDFNRYQIAVNFPSVFSNHPTRVTEALACGCALVTNSTGISEVDALFENQKHLWTYRDKQELVEGIKILSSDSGLAERIATEGYQYCMDHFTLQRHLSQILEWIGSSEIRSEKMSQRSGRVDGVVELKEQPKILVDGVIFYLQKQRPLGISRVWKTLLTEMGKTAIAEQILLLDRDSTAPEIAGIRKRPIGGYDFIRFEGDSLYLQKICEEERAKLLISTYHTYAENTHTLIMLHDMIPELTGQDLTLPEWRAKAKAIEKASAFFAVSQSTINDFRMLYPQYENKPVFLTPNAVSNDFCPHSLVEIADFKQKYHIHKPYFILVGHRMYYKNAILFFRAFSLLPNKADFAIVCTGGEAELERLFLPYVRGIEHHVLFLSDEELSTALSGAIALVYPSRYEGFGLPILEAMASGCPVITCRNSSIPEVAGDAVLCVGESDVRAMQKALLAVQDHRLRSELIEKGYENVKRFSWSNTTQMLISAIQKTLVDLKNAPLNQTEPFYTALRLIRYLDGTYKNKPYLQSMVLLFKMFNGRARYDHLLMEECEKTISQMDDHVFSLIKEAVSHSEECDAFIFYCYGLALMKRGLLVDAYHAFLRAIDRYNWLDSYKWRLADLASDVAIRLGMFSQAEQLLSMVISEHPTYQRAKQRMNQIHGMSEAGTINEREIEKNRRIKVVDSTGQEEPNGLQEHHKTDPPVVSVIISTYNSAKFLEGCLEDIESQTIADRLEIIVVNSGSQQNEERIVKQFQKRYRNIVYLHTEERESVYAAWNRAIRVAHGKYLTNANVDDRHRRDALEIMVRTLESNPDVGVVYADCVVTYKENTTLEKGPIHGRFRWPDFDRRLLFQSCFIGPQPMWRKELHEQFGLFDEEFESAGDYEFWLRISDKTKFLHLPMVLGLYLLSPASIEHRNATLSVEEAERARIRYWNKGDGERPPVGRSYLEMYSKPNGDGLDQHFPLVSVIIPTYNRPVQLRRAIESVLSQTYPEIEIIVVNDAGQDVGSMLRKMEAKRKIYSERHQKNMGAGAARNTGMRYAHGKYIAFLDDDDRYHPQHIYSLVAELESNPSLVAAYTDAIQITQVHQKKGRIQTEQKVVYSTDFSPEELMVHNYIPILCIMFRKEALATVGYFDEKLPALEDWEWLIRLSRAGRFSHLPFVTAEYVVRYGSKSRNMLSQEAIQNIYQKIYRECSPYSSLETRMAQKKFYQSMTGRDLWVDLPELANMERELDQKEAIRATILPERPSKTHPNAAEILQNILEAEDIVQAIEDHRDEFNEELLELINANAEAARADGDFDLAEGLEDLLDYIRSIFQNAQPSYGYD